MQEGQEETAAPEEGSCAHSGGLWPGVDWGGHASQGSRHPFGTAHTQRPPDQDMTVSPVC